MLFSFAFGVFVLLVAGVLCPGPGCTLTVYLSVLGLGGMSARLRPASCIFYLLPCSLFFALCSDFSFPVLGELFVQKSYVGMVSVWRTKATLLVSEFAHRSEASGLFLSALMTGTPLGYANKVLLQEIGIYHLVVVSGLHVGFCASFISSALAPLDALFLQTTSRLRLRGIAVFLTSMFCLFFIFLSEGRASAKRALSLVLFKKYSGLFLPGLRRGAGLGFVFACQVLIFPSDFFSLGCLLSWCAYFLLWTSQKGAKGLLVTNIWLTLVSMVFFGQMHPLSFLWNFFLTPAFALFFSLAWLVFFLDLVFGQFPMSCVTSWFMELSEIVLMGLQWLHSVTAWMILAPSAGPAGHGFRLVCGLVLSAVFCLRCNNLSKNS